MSGECDICGQHTLECICNNYVSPDPIRSYGATVTITGPVVCNDGSKFEDYSWEQHLQYSGYRVLKDEGEMEMPSGKEF